MPLCSATPEHPERLTTVVLVPWDLPVVDGQAPPPASGERVLDDGRTQLVTRVPAADARFVVTSPDAAVARRLFDGLRIERLPACADVAGPPAVDPAATGPVVPQRVGTTTVCSWNDGRVDDWRWLTADQGAVLAAALQTAPSGLAAPEGVCATRLVDEAEAPHWTVTFDGGGSLWVAAGPCARPGVVGPNGATARLTNGLVDLLSRYAAGVGVVYGAAGGK